MKQLHIYTSLNNPMETYYHIGNPTEVPKDYIETKGVINLIVDDKFLYVEKQFPLRPEKWFDGGVELDNGFFKLDKPFLLDEDLVIEDLLKDSNIQIDIEKLGNVSLEIKLNKDESMIGGNLYEINITVTSDEEIFKDFDFNETLTYTKVESEVDTYNAVVGIKVSNEEVERLARFLINSVDATNLNTDTFKRKEKPRRERKKLRSDIFGRQDTNYGDIEIDFKDIFGKFFSDK